MVKLILVDDHQVILEGLSALLPTCIECEIVACCLSGEEAVQMAKKVACDVIIMDVFMIGKYSGVQATSLIKKNNPSIKILALSMLGDANTINAMLNSGADGYLIKNSSGRDLKEGIETVMADQVYIHRELLQHFVNGVVKGKVKKNLLISDMELKVLQCLADGLTSKQASAKLYRSEETVKSHRKSLLKKFGVKNVAELVAYAVRNQII